MTNLFFQLKVFISETYYDDQVTLNLISTHMALIMLIKFFSYL